jgi:hypothetical protein
LVHEVCRRRFCLQELTNTSSGHMPIPSSHPSQQKKGARNAAVT